MHVHDQILLFIKANGPIVPTKVAKAINTEILFASAHLSDLATQRKVKISSLKVGSSPLYYLPGQEAQLYSFAQGNMNPKDYDVLEMLRERKVIRETDLDLLPRVALRSLKDFAIPLQVRTTDNSELFWKWYLLSDEETNEFIATILQKDKPPQQKPIEAKASVIEDPQALPPTLAEAKPVRAVKKRESLATKKEKVERQEKLAEKTQEQKAQFETIKELAKSKEIEEDDFLETVQSYCKNLDILINDTEVIRRSKELNLIIKVPSVVGHVTYFCKAKNKQKFDEKDLSLAYMEAHMKKLPLLLLYSDELTKKAEEMLKSGSFDNVIIKRITEK